MEGLRPHKRATLTPSQSSQQRRSVDICVTPPAARTQPSIAPPTHAERQGAAPTTLFDDVVEKSPAPLEEPCLVACLTYADVRAVQDYYGRFGFDDKSSDFASHLEGSPYTCGSGGESARRHERALPEEHGVTSVGDSEDALSERDEHAWLEVEANVLWGTGSVLETLRRAHPNTHWPQRSDSPRQQPLSAAHSPSAAGVDPGVQLTEAQNIPRGASGQNEVSTDSPSLSPTLLAMGSASSPRAHPHTVPPSLPTRSAALWSVQDFEWGPVVREGVWYKVFAAWERRTGYPVMIKRLPKDWLVLNNELQALQLEIGLQRRVCEAAGAAEAGVQRLFAYFWDDTHVFLVMEAVISSSDRSSSLEDRLARGSGGCLSETEARHSLRQIVRAVAAVHAKHVVHRRVQTSNLWITADGDIKLCDFSGAVDSRETHTTLPTRCALDYVAPEVLRGEPWTCAADMWSVGVVAWRLLCGAVPDSLRSPHRKRRGLAQVEVEFPSHVSAEARDLLQGLLSELPETRLTARAALRQAFLLEAAPSTFTPTRALVLPDTSFSPVSPSPSPSLRPLILTSILKKKKSHSEGGGQSRRSAAREHTPLSSFSPSSPVPSVSATSASPLSSWRDHSTPPSLSLTAKANTMPSGEGQWPQSHARRATAANTKVSPRDAGDESFAHESPSVSLSPCSFSASGVAPPDHRDTATASRYAHASGPASLRTQLSASSAGVASTPHANSSWAVSSTTLNVSSLTALTVSSEDCTAKDGGRLDARSAGFLTADLSDLDSPVPSPVPSMTLTMARRKLSYSSASLDSSGTQGVSVSRPQTTGSASTGRGPSRSLASLTAMTSAVPFLMSPPRLTATHSSPYSHTGRAAGTTQHAECAHRLRFDDSTTTSSTDEATGSSQEGDVQWHRPIAAGPVKSQAPRSAEEAQRRERRVVVLSPLTPSGFDDVAGLPRFADDERPPSERQTVIEGRGAAQPHLSFTDSLVVSPLTQSLVSR